MVKFTDTRVQCPVHRLYGRLRKSSLVRTGAAANIAALRFLRDCIDGRLAKLQGERSAESEEKTDRG